MAKIEYLLSVLGSNKRAQHVYKKCGFKYLGKIKRGVKMLNGIYTDNIIMNTLPKIKQFTQVKKN